MVRHSEKRRHRLAKVSKSSSSFSGFSDHNPTSVSVQCHFSSLSAVPPIQLELESRVVPSGEGAVKLDNLTLGPGPVLAQM